MARTLVRGDIHLFPFERPDKRRPVVILTLGDVVNQLTSVTVAPISSSIRNATSEVRLDIDDGMKGPCVVKLHNLMTVEQSKLGPRVTSLSSNRMKEICVALRFALDCDCD